MENIKIIPASELIINSDGSVFHLHMKPEQLADNVILVGDPGRVALVGKFFESVECTGSSREFNFITGRYGGVRFTVLSTGIGSDNIDIVMNELDALANVDFETRMVKPVHKALSILRIGTCGAIQPDVPLGAYIFSEVSIGFDGVLNWYEGRDKVADTEIEDAFVKHVKWDGHLPSPYFVYADRSIADRFRGCTYAGMTISAAGFYGPQGREVRLGLAMPDMLEDIESFSFSGRKITNFEMESAALAGLSSLLGHKAGTVCCAVAHRYIKDVNTDYHPLIEGLVKLSLDKLSE